jgi:hypothetical protein
MEKPKIKQLIAKLDKLLDRYVDNGPEPPDLKVRPHLMVR